MLFPHVVSPKSVASASYAQGEARLEYVKQVLKISRFLRKGHLLYYRRKSHYALDYTGYTDEGEPSS